MKVFLKCALFLFCLNGFAQTNPKAELYYKDANYAFDKMQYEIADSLFSLSLRYQSNVDAYFNQAACRQKLGDRAGYCEDLMAATNLSDPEAEKIFWSDCAKCDTIYKNRKTQFKVKINSSYKEIVITDLKDSSAEYSDYSINNKLLRSYHLEDADTIYGKCDTEAAFPKGVSGLWEYLKKNIDISSPAIKGIRGTVYISFIINETGDVKKIKVVKGIQNCKDCDDAAADVLSHMPKWKPATYNGKPVSKTVRLPLKFNNSK